MFYTSCLLKLKKANIFLKYSFNSGFEKIDAFSIFAKVFKLLGVMKKIVAYLLSVIHYFVFITTVIVSHPIQFVAYNVFGYKAHKRIIDVLNFLLVQTSYLLLCRPTFHGFKNLPKGKPFIIVSNHQSMYDIPPIGWAFRKHHAKYISKKELGKNLSGISYNLRKGGSVLIDRKNGSQSIREIIKLGKRMEKENWSACIFPEGSRSKTGELRKFQEAGFKTLLKASPNALIVPFVVNGNYKLHKWGQFPLNFGIRLKYTVLEPIDRNSFESEHLLEIVKEKISNCLAN